MNENRYHFNYLVAVGPPCGSSSFLSEMKNNYGMAHVVGFFFFAKL